MSLCVDIENSCWRYLSGHFFLIRHNRDVAIDFAYLTNFPAYTSVVISMPEGLKKFALIPGLIDVDLAQPAAHRRHYCGRSQ